MLLLGQDIRQPPAPLRKVATIHLVMELTALVLPLLVVVPLPISSLTMLLEQTQPQPVRLAKVSKVQWALLHHL